MVDMHSDTGSKLTPLGWVRYSFRVVRKNALKCCYLYNFRYTQKDRRDAYIEYLEHLIEQHGYKMFKTEEKNND